MMKILICASLLFSLESFAKKGNDRKLASNEQRLLVTTVFGEAVSSFQVLKSENKYSISFSAGQAPARSREISKADFDFILDEYSKLVNPAKVPADCYRSRIDIVLVKNGMVESQKASCYGQNTSTEAAYVRFSKILVTGI